MGRTTRGSGRSRLIHAIGRSRGGLTTKSHLVCDGKGRALAFLLTPGQVVDTSMLIETLSEIRVAGRTGRPRSRPDRVLADKGYPSRRTEPGSASATSPRRSPNVTTRSPTAAGSPDGQSTSALTRRSDTRAATSSNGAPKVQAMARHRNALR
ncbi:transposase [Ornithinimicrobium pratense]|uniref:Transposase n=1 Tax=Ornithinimicrobium pratense TaxID=2593973 RepID=A0A5J6VAS7_9MICO|nr:transposase [Ornithinimicrobium pratense]